MRRKNKEPNELPNLLELTPQRVVDSTKRDDGRIDLVVPKFRHKWLKKFFMKKLKQPTWRVELDEVGSFVWQNVDGIKNVGKIGKELENEFGEKVEPVYERLNQFFYMMRNQEFIRFIGWSGKE